MLKGQKHTEEAIERMKEAHLGKKFSMEHRLRLSESKAGNKNPFYNKKHSPQSIQKIRKHSQGINNPRYGKHLSEETKAKISKAHEGKQIPTEVRIKISKANTGKRHKDDTRKKISYAQRGANGNNWKGGISPEQKVIRESIEYSLWRESVFARDHWTCQECESRKGTFNAHHLKAFCKFPELRFAIDNGKTLCVECHKLKHKRLKKRV